MRSSILISALSGLVLVYAASQSVSVPSVSIPDNPATSFLAQTNSRGVVTGQPAAVTSQPPAATSQPTQPGAASIPAGLSTAVVPINPVSSSASGKSGSPATPVSSGASSATGSGSSGSVTGNPTAASSGSGSPTNRAASSSTAAAALATVAPVGLSLGLAGAIFAAFL
ncbi:hypothetical protein Egran_06460 [Elaphomyces granulatus]|uniref:Uncharacterized protein n=1 Tax=Elaphomyces granulatus TaxID=519963 RepID=A0A232LNS3_9EURO|nr:hypothetical protein Egran_06460 [Elaphomyces granulatus]